MNTPRFKPAPGMLVLIARDVGGRGYYIEPLCGFGGKDPFGGWRWRNIVSAKQAAVKIAHAIITGADASITL